MKHILHAMFAAGLGGVLSSCATQDNAQSEVGAASYYPEPGMFANFAWPRIVISGETTNIIYEPQADSWDGYQLRARSAVGVQSAGQAQTSYGVVTLQAVTLVDKTRRTVSLENIQITRADFPSAQPKLQEYLKLERESFPKHLEGLSLDRMEASMAAAPHPLKTSGPSLNNAPPKIIFSTQPAILVYIDGPPVYRPVAGTGLQRVINTGLLLLRDPSGQLYLHVRGGYLAAPSLEGPWVVAGEPPTGAAEAEQQAMASPTPVDLLDGQTDVSTNLPPTLTSATAPAIYVATSPTELILFDGQPNFVPIAGTHLLYGANTTGNVFKLLTDQQTYVLLAGRWFRAPSLRGPWQFVPAEHLAPDFANIPDTSPKENVKASVPGTEQATEALIANSIPESTKVPRAAQMQDPQIDGLPRMQPIAGTPLYYVANSSTPIIEVDGQSWYACQNGIWYVAPSLQGPWQAATSVPAVIYSIPPTSPLHYVTYVHVYGATPESVYEGYTPGYFGTEVEDGTVVYGTGYDYPPWIGDDWYGWPVTWGFGWGPCWTPWDDWCFDYGFGWGCGFRRFGWWHCHPPRPWWGPNRTWGPEGGLMAWRRNDTANTGAILYGAQSPHGGIGTRPMAGEEAAAGYARAYNSRTGAVAAGQGASAPSAYRSLLTLGGESRYWGNRAPEGRFSEFGEADYARGFYGRSLSGRAVAGGWRGASHGYSGGGYSHGGWGGHGGGGGGGHGGGGGGGGHR